MRPGWTRFTSDRVWKFKHRSSSVLVGIGDNDRYFWWSITTPGCSAHDYGASKTLEGAMEEAERITAERAAIRCAILGGVD